MYEFIGFPSDNESFLVDSLYFGMKRKCFEKTKHEIQKIPTISNFERINFYLFRKYSITIKDGIELFEGKLVEELKETCRKIIKYCKE